MKSNNQVMEEELIKEVMKHCLFVYKVLILEKNK